jgi:hypothetical protein
MQALQPGDRIRLVEMPDDPAPILPGTTGTVVWVREQGTWLQVGVAWDNGRTLMLSMPPDRVEVLADR